MAITIIIINPSSSIIIYIIITYHHHHLSSSSSSSFIYHHHLLFQENPGNSVPVSGLAYYISPPQTIAEIARDPVHAVFYLLFILASCALFSKTWIEVSGSSPKGMLTSLK